MPNAARTLSSGRVQAVPISATASTTLRSDLSEAVFDCVAAQSSFAFSASQGWRSRPPLTALRSVSYLMPNSPATSFHEQPRLSNTCARVMTASFITVPPRPWRAR